MTKDYFAAREGSILGAYRKVGDKLGPLTDQQAKYLVMAGHITAEPPAKPKAKRTASQPEPVTSKEGEGS